ncbi:VOC family protein [Pedobacter sp. N36a]|uniref:VOC family protein n=1 Tax=Pedobacter sp. N36a TaxID=2767996 RepID=UPI001656F10E|nr:VOC family protein [Pedobacter sp. N36a]MBC8984387.1 VOC family protein [Pedobacter sp. N36a]
MTERSKIKGLHHLAIRAQDFEKTLQFYTDALDFSVVHTWTLPEFNIKQAAMIKSWDGQTFIEIFDGAAEVPMEGEAAKAGEAVKTGALLHLAMSVVDAAAAYERCLHAGASPYIAAMNLSLGHPPVSVRNALVYSPNGEVIEFLEGQPF